VSAAVTLPTWAVYVASFGAPVGAFLGVLFAQWVLRKGAKELEHRSKREEVLRNMRWAAELAVSEDPSKADMGVAQLLALSDSDLTDSVVQAFVDAALDVVADPAADEVEKDPDARIEPAPADGGASTDTGTDPKPVDLDRETQGGDAT
jgi:hypothetical protein